MAYEVNWHVEGRVIFIRLHGDMGIEDIMQINQNLTDMLRAGSKPVHVIANSHELGKMPINIPQLSQHLGFLREPSLGAIIAVGSHNVFTRFLATMLTQLSRIELKMANTFDDAIAILQRLDPALDVSKTRT